MHQRMWLFMLLLHMLFGVVSHVQRLITRLHWRLSPVIPLSLVVQDSRCCSTEGIAEPSSVGSVARPPTKLPVPTFLETSQDPFHFDKIHIGSSSLEMMNCTALRGNLLH